VLADFFIKRRGHIDVAELYRAPGSERSSRLLLEALQRLGMKNVILLSPYKSNKNVSKQPAVLLGQVRRSKDSSGAVSTSCDPA